MTSFHLLRVGSRISLIYLRWPPTDRPLKVALRFSRVLPYLSASRWDFPSAGSRCPAGPMQGVVPPASDSTRRRLDPGDLLKKCEKWARGNIVQLLAGVKNEIKYQLEGSYWSRNYTFTEFVDYIVGFIHARDTDRRSHVCLGAVFPGFRVRIKRIDLPRSRTNTHTHTGLTAPLLSSPKPVKWDWQVLFWDQVLCLDGLLILIIIVCFSLAAVRSC